MNQILVIIVFWFGIDKIYQNAKKWDLNENEDLCVNAFSEMLIKEGNYDNYPLNNLSFKLEHFNFEKIKTRDKTIVNFVMPEFKNELYPGVFM